LKEKGRSWKLAKVAASKRVAIKIREVEVEVVKDVEAHMVKVDFKGKR